MGGMAPADHPYRVRPASADDLPAVLSILAERPDGTGPATAEPSDREEAAWERVMATRELTVYLAEDGTEAAGTASMMLMPHDLYRALGFTPEAEGFRLYLDP